MLKNGTVKVRAKYFWIGPFEDGVAEVRNTSESDLYHINKDLEKIESML
jgi:hypothetical protein